MGKQEYRSGGSNNIPPSERKTPYDFIGDMYDPGCDKEIVFDWVSFVFDDIKYISAYNSTKGLSNIQRSPENDRIINDILRLMNDHTIWRSKEIEGFAHNGYRFSFMVGEFVQINFMGPKAASGNHTTQILMTGQACTEFIENRKGKWYDFFYYLRNELNGHFRRVDLAIDDYTGRECDIYHLEKYALDLQWTGSFRMCNVIHGVKKQGNSKLSTGFSITFGSSAGTQLQQYDKNLERKAKRERTRNTQIWYRHEMRIVGEKADNLIDVFLASQMVDPGLEDYLPEFDFVKFAFGLLASMLRYKKNPGSDLRHLYEQDDLPEWMDFLGNYQNVDIHTNGQRKGTWNQKKEWNERSMTRQHAMFVAVLGYDEYIRDHMHHIGVAMSNLTAVQKEIINKKLESIGYERLTDIDFKELSDRYIIQNEDINEKLERMGAPF
jgi:hypothetical protein